jgi:hypothetical protein
MKPLLHCANMLVLAHFFAHSRTARGGSPLITADFYLCFSQ